MGDIGMHFPPGDPAYKDISSLKLLEEVVAKLKNKGFRVNNTDTTVVAEQPRLREYVDQMRANLARVLETDISRVSVKASTSNLLGFVGREEGMAAWAISTITGE
jgi:2-C-methyl-D-erythritol 2,4-cyclodiphosphate synthase